MTERQEERLKAAVRNCNYKRDLRDAIAAALDELDRLRDEVRRLRIERDNAIAVALAVDEEEE